MINQRFARIARVLVGLLLVWALPTLAFDNAMKPASRGARQIKAISMEDTMQDSDVSLSATFAPSSSGLKLKYRVTNQRKTPILLFNRLHYSSGAKGDVQDEQQVYRFVSGESLRLLLGRAPLPMDEEVFASNSPRVTRLDARSSLEEEITLPLPVREYSYYYPQEGEHFSPGKVSDAELFLMYVDGSQLETEPSKTVPDALLIKSYAWRGAEELLRSGSVPLAVEALVYKREISRLELPEDKPTRVRLPAKTQRSEPPK